MDDFGMNDSYYGEGGFNNPTDGQDGGAPQRTQTRQYITPATIKQVNDAEQMVIDHDWVINNVNLNMVTLVGIVRSITEAKSTIQITIEDGTGSLNFRKWITQESSLEIEREKLAPFLNGYVRVTGYLKQQNETKTFNLVTIKPVEDHNEVIYHQLNAIYWHLAAQGAVGKNGAKSEDKSLFIGDEKSQLGLSAVDRVLKIIRERASGMEEGVTVNFIAAKLQLDEDSVRRFCNDLSEAGKIYNGYVDDSYLALENIY